ncbi:MAG: flagellar filament capping protein FliD [Terriglobia bacterium]
MSSPITLSGFNNIDFKSIINIIMQSERQPVNNLNAQVSTQQSRLDAFGSLNTSITDLKAAFDVLKSQTSYGSLQATSSNTNVVGVHVTSSASRGSFNLDVTSLARPQVTASAARQFSDINADIIDGGTFSITQGGVTTNIDLTNVTTVSELRDAINNQQSGVVASIINDGSSLDSPARPFRLILTSATPGVANSFTIHDQTSWGGSAAGSVLNLSTDPINGVAMDTQFSYNGLQVRSDSIVVSDAIPGMTLNLMSTGSSVITVSDDDSALKSKIKAVVDAFNNFGDFVQAQSQLAPANGTRPPLASDPMLRTLNRQLRNYFTTDIANSGGLKNVAEIGISLNRSGKLQIDDAALSNALSTHRSDVKALLSGTSGLAGVVSDFLGSYIQAGGPIESEEDRIKKTISSYNNRILSLEAQLAVREKVLTDQFTQADQAISQLNSQANALNGLAGQYRLF